MYRVLCDGLPIYDLRDETLNLIDPKLVLEVNDPGSFTFKIPLGHPQYDLPAKMKSLIQVYHDEEEIFAGRIIQEKRDFYNRKAITCEGQLAYLNDSIQRPAEYHDMTVRGYLETLIASHNEQVEAAKRFEVGIVTVTDSNDSLFRYTNMNSTMKEIKEDLIDDLGGYLRVRNWQGHRYLDYISEYDTKNTQSIEFGENLLDFSRNIDLTDIATAIIPLGAKLEESPIAALEQRLTIEDVNNGLDYLCNQEAVNAYGWVLKTVTWDNVTTPEMLKSKGQKWLTDNQFDGMVIEAKAVDLHYTDEEIEQFKLGDNIKVHSSFHGLEKYFPLTKMTINLNKLSNNSITLGGTVKATLTTKTASAQSDIKNVSETVPVASAIVKSAIAQATALITAATHGHVVTTAEEQLIMDTNDVKTATKVWRWNLNGLGYSKTGYNGTYETAITMDGQIVGERLIGGSVSADKLSVSYTSQVTKEIADAEEAARQDAEDYTDGKLKSYYTKSEVTTAIKNSADAVTISAKETAVQYVDGKLKNYSTSAEIKVTTDAITSTVNKKLNSSDFSTTLQQSAYAVKIAWNNISKYIQFESGELRIYDSTTQSNSTLLMKMNSNGAWYYYNGTTVGKIGTGGWANDDSFRGLMFGLNNGADYMCWGYQSTSGGNYIVNLSYYSSDRKFKKGLHIDTTCYVGGNLRFGSNSGVNSYSDNSIKIWASGGISIGDNDTALGKFTGTSFSIWNNRSIDFYSTLNLHGWGYTNDSDARMKKNIEETSINGLEIINGIDLKTFDWVVSGEHEPIGIIAQQIENIAPELVESCADGHLQLKADKLVYYCIKAIQELSQKMNLGFEIPIWSDPYSLLNKKEFCAKLQTGTNIELEPLKPEPQIIVNQKG